MPITSNLTSLEDFAGAPVLPGYGGGQGASINNDVIIEGIQSAGRRVDNSTNKGFGATIPATNLSGAGEHIKVWVFITQWAEVTQVQVRISSGSNDDHELPIIEYPPLGGFIPVWVDVSRTPEVGGSANEASITEIGVLIDIGDVGGNAPNLILDEIMHGTSGLLWDGTGGSLSDFRIYENTNSEGVLVSLNGVDFCYARLEIGSATATSFNDSGFTLIYPDQALVSSTFMGLSIDLQNASTAIDFSDATIQSSNVSSAINRPDLIVTGNVGSLTLDSVNLLGLRLATLTSGVSITGGIFDAIEITQATAEIDSSTIRTRSTAGISCIDDGTFGTTGIHDCDFVQSGTGHAIEITTTGSHTFSGLTFNGYGADGTTSAAVYNNSGGAITLNIIGGGSPTIRNGTGASTTVVANPVTTTIAVVDVSTGNPIENARVYLLADTGGPLAVDTVIISGLTNASGVIEDTRTLSSNQPVIGRVRKSSSPTFYKNGPISGIINSVSGASIIVQLIPDE